MQFYSDPSRESAPYALPDCEVFYRSESENRAEDWLDADDDPMPSGYYYWFCFPGCMPDSDAFGPFPSAEAAIASAQSEWSPE